MKPNPDTYLFLHEYYRVPMDDSGTYELSCYLEVLYNLRAQARNLLRWYILWHRP